MHGRRPARYVSTAGTGRAAPHTEILRVVLLDYGYAALNADSSRWRKPAYRSEISNFFGFDLARTLPYNIARTWHVKLSLFWVSTETPRPLQTEPSGLNLSV